MWDTIHDLAHTLWQSLPELTIGLRFGAAVIGFGLAAGAMARRRRRRQAARPREGQGGASPQLDQGASGRGGMPDGKAGQPLTTVSRAEDPVCPAVIRSDPRT
jgi:hypothetical protein